METVQPQGTKCKSKCLPIVFKQSGVGNRQPCGKLNQDEKEEKIREVTGLIPEDKESFRIYTYFGIYILTGTEVSVTVRGGDS